MISLRIFPYCPRVIASCSRKLAATSLTQSFLTYSATSQNRKLSLSFKRLNSNATSTPTTNSSPHLLSDVEELVERDLTFKDIEKEILPALPTTEELLKQCETLEDIFQLLNKAVKDSQLLKEELPLYIKAIAITKKRGERKMGSMGPLNGGPNVGSVELEKSQSFLDDPHLQFLIRETLTHALHFTSHDLTNIFSNFVHLGIPPSSNVVSLLIIIIQKRINDFFPKDVLHCLNALRHLPDDNPLFSSLKKGLLMHLENQVIDNVNFTRSLLGTNFISQLRLLKYVAKNREASVSLKTAILFTCTETVKRRPKQSLHNEKEMRHILLTLTTLGWQHKYLLRFAANYIRDHKGNLLEDHSELIKDCIEKLKIEDKVLLRRFRTHQPGAGRVNAGYSEKIPYFTDHEAH